jgi:hypothetical protein
MGGAVSKRRSVWCMLCAMHVSSGYATRPRISVAFIASSSTSWLLSRGSQELGRSTASLRLHACVRVSIL